MAVKTSEVAKILNASPDLPILCMVDGELCADDSCRRWAGCVGSVEVKEYVCLDPNLYLDTDQTIFWREDADEIVDMMIDCIIDESQEEGNNTLVDRLLEYDKASEAAVERVANMNWKKAVVLFIDLPEEDQSEKSQKIEEGGEAAVKRLANMLGVDLPEEDNG